MRSYKRTRSIKKAPGTAETGTAMTFLDLARCTSMGLETWRRLQSQSASMPGKILTRFLTQKAGVDPVRRRPESVRRCF